MTMDPRRGVSDRWRLVSRYRYRSAALRLVTEDLSRQKAPRRGGLETASDQYALA